MAQFKHPQLLRQNDSTAFDVHLTPGTISQNSGIYRCVGCAREIAANKEQPLPAQNHHQHGTAQGPVRWQLIVWAEG